MSYRLAWIGVASSGFVMVAAGAFGAHGLKDQLTPQLLETFETGVRYQAWHTLAMLAVLVWRANVPLKGQGLVLGLWAIGILLFSGSLYLLALTGIRGLGIVTPFGGLAFLAGWLALALCAGRSRQSSSS